MSKRKNTNIFALAMSISFLVAPQMVSGQPSITGVEGIVAHGETITITGNDIGPGAEILTWDTFESGSPGQVLHDSNPDIGFKWNVSNRTPENDHDMTYSGTRAKSGNMSGRWWLNSREQLYFGWVGKGPYKELYWSYWIYNRMQYQGQDCSTYIVPDELFNYKRAYTYGRGGSLEGPQLMQGAIMENRTYWTAVTQNQGSGVPAINCKPNPSHYYADGICQWDRFETFIRNEDDGQSNGIIKMWVNNSTDEPNCWSLGGVDEDCDALDISGFSGSDAWIRDWRLGYLLRPYWAYDFVQAWYDNIYCATSRARVEIGDNANFADCTRRGICPHVTWDGSTVEVEISADSYSEGEQAYLFIIDENGDVSQGYGIEIGESSEISEDTILPENNINDSVLPLDTPPPHLARLSGSASDNVAVVEVTWQNSLGGQGTAQGTTSWIIDDILLFEGDNVVTVTARDSANNLGTDQITIPWIFPPGANKPLRNQ